MNQHGEVAALFDIMPLRLSVRGNLRKSSVVASTVIQAA